MTDTSGDVVERELMTEPHVAGRRVPVRKLQTEVEEQGDPVPAVAARFDLDPETVYRALAYAHEHPEEMATVREELEASFERFREKREGTAEPEGSSAD